MIKKILFVLLIILISSCGNNQTKPNVDSYEEDILGFWNRVGTIQLMNGIEVDTLAFKDSENPGNKQIKAYLSDRVMWLNNFGKILLLHGKEGPEAMVSLIFTQGIL